ncbi:MAG TPA: hypothetical protein VFR18_26720, partial [Terriglobia bacterium]|nr:hypothetical protein [Terriglobia bacterium]
TFFLKGGFELTLSSSNIRLVGNAELDVPLLDPLYAALDLQISSSGIVSTIVLGSSAGQSSQTEIKRTGLGFDARFRLEVNTTASTGTVNRIRINDTTGAVVLSGGVPVVDSVNIAARTVRLVGAGLLLLREGSASSQTDSFVVTGRFELVISDDNVSVTAFGFINLGRIDPGFTLQVNGSFTITSIGVVASLALGGTSRHERSGDGFTFDARLQLEINTTTLTRDVSRPQVDRNTGSISGTTTAEISQRTIQVAASGSLQLGSNSLFTVHGYFVMTFTTGGLTVAMDSRLKFLNTYQLDVDGTAGIFTSDPGIAMDIDLSLGGDTTPLFDKGYFSTNAGVRLRVNTRDATETFGVPVNAVRVRINGNFGADGFDFDGAFNFTASGTRWVATLNISVDVFGFVEVDVTGSVGFDTDRTTPNDTLSLSGSVGISVGDSNNGASLTLRVSFSNSGDFTATATGTGKIFGITAGSVSGTLYESGRLGLDFYAAGVYLGHLDFSLSSSGSALMGPIAGATVFFDSNGNLLPDEGEPSAITDELGAYTLPDGWTTAFDRNGNGQIDDDEGYLVAIGGIDTTTGLPLVGALKTLAGDFGSMRPLILSPLSTVYTYLVDALGSRDAASTALSDALGVPLMTGMDFATFDPFAAALAGPQQGGDFYVGGVQLSSIATDIEAYLGAASPGTNSGELTAFVYQHLAEEILATPGVIVDLGAPDLIRRVIDNTVASLDLASPPEVAAAAAIIANAAQEIEVRAGAGAGDIETILVLKGTVQGPIAGVLEGLGNGTISATSALAQTIGAGFDNLLANVTVPGLPDDIELPAPQLIMETLPDGTVNLQVVALVSEQVLDGEGNPLVDRFHVTVPLPLDGELFVDQVTVDARIDEGGPAFLEVRSSIDNYQSVVARVATKPGLATYAIPLNLPGSTEPVTLQIVGVEASAPDAGIEFVRVNVTAVLTRPAIAPGLVEDPWEPGKTALKVVGTDGDDSILIVTQGKSGTIAVLINGKIVGEYEPTGHIVVYGLAGDDRMIVSGNISVPVILIGGDGDDSLQAGDTSTILLGGRGNDTLLGGRRRSLLVGGDGEDSLTGSTQDDILIADAVDDLESLVDVMRVWNRTDLSYDERVSLLGGPLMISGITIDDDDDLDKIVRSGGQDWTFN